MFGLQAVKQKTPPTPADQATAQNPPTMIAPCVLKAFHAPFTVDFFA